MAVASWITERNKVITNDPLLGNLTQDLCEESEATLLDDLGENKGEQQQPTVQSINAK